MSNNRLKFQNDYSRLKEKENEINKTILIWNFFTFVGLLSFAISFALLFSLMPIIKEPIDIINELINNPLRSIFFYALIFYAAGIVIIRRYGGKNRKKSLTITLNNEDIIFLRYYELYGCLNNFLIEPKDKEHFRKNALSKMEEIMQLIDEWNYGNLMLIKNVIYEKINILKSNLNNFYSNIKYGDDSDVKKVLKISDKILEYFLNPDLNKLDILINSFNIITIKRHMDKTYIDKIWEFIEKRPIVSRLLCSLVLIILFILISHLLGFGIPPFWSLLLVYFGLWQIVHIIFGLGHTGLKLIPTKSQDDKNHLSKIELLSEEFKDYNVGDKLKFPWMVEEDRGNIVIMSDIESSWNSKKCVKIDGLRSTYIKYIFGDTQKVNIDYYLKHIHLNEYGYGSPFIIESSDYVNRNEEDHRAIYMEINKNILRYDLGNKDFLKLKDFTYLDNSKWYHIVLNIDCENHSYEFIVNNKKETMVFPPEFKSINSIRTKYAFGEVKWQTLIGKIIINKILN